MRVYSRVLLIPCAVLITTILYYQGVGSQRPTPKGVQPPGCHASQHHPIDDLVSQAANTWSSFVSNETTNIKDGAAAYRARRGRHPPPGFEAWYNYAKSSGSVVIEEFFDQIYRDIEPLWGVEPKALRSSVAGFPDILTIRDGRVQDVPNEFFRTKIWVEMVNKIVKHLPDMDLALNRLDEARVIASRKVLDDALKRAKAKRSTIMKQPVTGFISDMSGNSDVAKNTAQWVTDKEELHKAIRASCPGGSPLTNRIWPWVDNESARRSRADQYVDNIMDAKDICQHHDMTSQHGALIEPATVDFTTSLVPIFTGSKLPVYNDIVIPEPSYYSDDPRYTGKTLLGDWSTWYPWKSKIHGLVWRGGSTGGAAQDDTWQYFHRHRLIARLNATEFDEDVFVDRPAGRQFTHWLASVADVGFTKLFCGQASNAEHCTAMASHFALAKPIKMASQYRWKYLPDTDGNSISERFRAFLLSNSAPIKASIFDDWQDHRILPWRHYIPMHISYYDLHGIMAYFLGYDKTCAHDEMGERIAEQGRQWSEKVLRKDDMVIYLHRVLLEYARVVHDNRDRLGYVSDLS